MNKITIILALVMVWFTQTMAQTTFPVNGPADLKPGKYAFTNAHIYADATHIYNKATLLISNDEVEAIGENLQVPTGYITIDINGAYIYPSFIDLISDYGIQKPSIPRSGRSGPQMGNNRQGAVNWNQAIHPETNAIEIYKQNDKDAQKYLQAGFGTVLTHWRDGIMRGTGALVSLADTADQLTIINNKAATFYSFSKGSSTQDYPSSLMGAIALIRQTNYDALWYKSQKKETDISFEAYNETNKLPKIFEAGDKYNSMRAAKIANEFGQKFVLKGSGDEYQRIADIKSLGMPFIIPVNFPQPVDVSDAYDAQNVSLSVLLHWELAPTNLYQCAQNQVPFAITLDECKDATTFYKNLRKAIICGISDTALLNALTITPARLIGAEDKIGSLAKGKLANFIITSGPVFSDNSVILQNWTIGRQNTITPYNFNDIRGHYTLKTSNSAANTLVVKGNNLKPEMKLYIGKDTSGLEVKYKIHDTWVELEYHIGKDSTKQSYRLSGLMQRDEWAGMGTYNGDQSLTWTISEHRIDTNDLKEKKPEKITYTKPQGHVLYPFTGLGNETLPKQEDILFKNATVWTGEADTELTNTDVLISQGKIKTIGKNLNPSSQDTKNKNGQQNNIRIIDCSGKYLTAGIIDEHSHIAVNGDVNEGTQSVTSEVRIGDVVNPEDINIYRQLSGGVTSSHLLHGSANCIGGQTQLIKLRFGYNADDMKNNPWTGFIKFALGENVKQSNWGDQQTVRYPQSRMGVEQTICDAFTRAKAYQAQLKIYNSLSTKQKAMTTPPRRDLELDALVEILESKRFITCHSYVQSEINMLMGLADSFGFRVNTFTHILEGYKVADKMKAHGANASTFSDWWAYKMEVSDAIPYNSALMTKMGINTAVNSDDAEMARRLNQEAAKSIKYGGLNKWQAWSLCTINPAKMLHIDDRTGSIKVGKEADIVIWNAMPLSIYAHPLYSFVDGICFYDEVTDTRKQDFIKMEKQRLRKKMLEAAGNGETTIKPKPELMEEYDCEVGK